MAASLARSMLLNEYVHEEESVGAQRSNLLLDKEEDIALYTSITSTAMFMLHVQPFQNFAPNSSHSNSPTNLLLQKHRRLDACKIGGSLVESAAVGVLECKLWLCC